MGHSDDKGEATKKSGPLTKYIVPRDRAQLADLGEILFDSPVGTLLQEDPLVRDQESARLALDWWKEWMELRGCCLSPELEAAPPDMLAQAFRRGRTVSLSPGQPLQDEGTEVHHFSIVLQGRLRLRCRVQKNDVDETDAAAAGVDADGFLMVGTVALGEAFGYAPGEQRSSHDVVALERTVLLVLSVADYKATLRSCHRQLQWDALSFLAKHSICPSAPPAASQRLACCMRIRRFTRGKTIVERGDLQRQVFILRRGVCSVSVPEVDPAVLGYVPDSDRVRQQAEAAEEQQQYERRQCMKVSCTGALAQQERALVEQRQQVVSQFAVGRLKRSLRSGGQLLQHRTNTANPVLGFLGEPGQMLNEEVFCCEGLRDMIFSRSYCTAKAEQDCEFYVLDFTTFRTIVLYGMLDQISHSACGKLSRRSSHVVRLQMVAEQRAKHEREYIKSADREDNPKIRMPASAGYEGPSEVEDKDEWLQLAFDHRRAPRNHAKPPSLKCLEVMSATGTVPPGFVGGPGVQAMLRVFTDESTIKSFRIASSQGKQRRRSTSGQGNPMGEMVPPTADYVSVSPWLVASDPADLAEEKVLSPTPSTMLLESDSPTTPLQSQLADGSSFFQTALPDIDEARENGEEDSHGSKGRSEKRKTTQARPESAMSPDASRPGTALSGRSRTGTAAAPSPNPASRSESNESRGVSASRRPHSGASSIRSDPRQSSTTHLRRRRALRDTPAETPPRTPGSTSQASPATSSSRLATSHSLPMLVNKQSEAGSTRAMSKDFSKPTSPPTRSGTVAPQSSSRPLSRMAQVALSIADHSRCVKDSFTLAIRGKSVLCLTDKADVRRSVHGAMQDSCLALCFLQSTNELWQRLSSPKEPEHHALIVDLTKAELKAEAVLRAVRGHTRYGALPVVVLAPDGELDEYITSTANFVVFLPIAANMMREALLWVLQKRRRPTLPLTAPPALMASVGEFDSVTQPMEECALVVATA